MKFSIGVRLFFAVLISMIAVSALILLLMREKIGDSFADYTQKIELDRLQEVSDSIEARYAQHGDWRFLPQSSEKKQDWIAEELLRLYARHLEEKTSALERELSMPASPPSVPSETNIRTTKATRSVSTRSVPAMPSPPPTPPLPPLPPPRPSIPDQPSLSDAVELPDFFSRISLFDFDERYLAGQRLSHLPINLRPLFYEGRIIAYLGIQKSAVPSDVMSKDFLSAQADTILLSIVASILFSAAVASLLAYHFRRPLLHLAKGAKQLAEGEFEVRLPAQRSDELGELARSFNQLAEKLQQAEQSRRQWVADTSHELRTPISVLRAQLEAIQDGIRSANPDNIALMLRQILSLNKLIDELYALARSDLGELSYHFQQIDLRALVAEECANFSEKFSKAQLTLNKQLGESEVWLHADADRLRQVLINLLENSVRYTHAGGQLRVSIEAGGEIMSKDKRYKQSLHLHIADSAPGLTPSELARLGERFYRAEASRNRERGGAGLGLAMCKKIIQAHQGKLSFSCSDLGGLAIDIQLPIID